ncbi:NAD-dependent succinate-semialdehyde dehydrogenase [Niabella drilacis]|uniref:Succinate-semialdehyde dehydrogenase / glutarate-semialdehyde dehydrogenase n=1 Tax=Niabella drilacis (strain DSM 25811 / CCM 8410 / CCUG 62505 / LMG 26954 / E90) TaxID=1285928 RepID=A0A1G6LVI9_NIADE|nr:NAD-dependent succinate-semialdehyde dehydrogenase [Niabella drilacis]SDC47282.1 succinate-semialdehyde dehydrogenase / glutarate-semialdehyde dehydrogenase [Niabella drilacis]
MAIQSINPLNGKRIQTYKEETAKTVGEKIEAGHKAWLKWRTTSFEARGRLLLKAAAVLQQQKSGLALLMAQEMGKPLKDGIAEVEKCASVCEYYAANGAAFLKDQKIKTDARNSFVTCQPIGVVLAVMPWNFPYWQCFRFIAPALMAGNTGLLKHASNVPGCALSIEQVLLKAGFPRGVFHTLLVGSKAVKGIIEHPLVKAVTLTGSTEAGRQVAAQAGGQIKKTVLELGGSDPYVILEDADLELAATVCAQSRLINNGQSCIAAKRFIVVRQVEKEFVRLFKEKMSNKRLGDPLDPATDLGPMSRADLRDELHRQVLENIEAGAVCILGGTIPDFKGTHAFYTPTILTGIKKGMSGYREELFGPVACVITARNQAHAIEIANDTSFGLGAAVFTRDIKKGECIAREQLQAGACFVNTLVKSDPRVPFGGINQSGYGRELGSFGIREFVNIKTVWR